MKTEITTASLITKEITKAKGDVTNYDCLYEIASIVQDDLGYDEARTVGYDGMESKGYEFDSEDIAHAAAMDYLISQGYDISPTATYDEMWDTLGLEAEAVYQSVWCAVSYDAAEMWVRW
jgi:hypothetical protein